MEATRLECQCPICHDLLVDAVKCPCCKKNAYCRFCLEQWVVKAPATTCPICRSSIPDPLPASDVDTNEKVAFLFKEESESRRLEVETNRAKWLLEREKKARCMAGSGTNSFNFFLNALIHNRAPVAVLFELVD